MMTMRSRHGNVDHGANTFLSWWRQASFYYLQSWWLCSGLYSIDKDTVLRILQKNSTSIRHWWLLDISHLLDFPFFFIAFADAAQTWLWNFVTLSSMHVRFHALFSAFSPYLIRRIKQQHRTFTHYIPGLVSSVWDFLHSNSSLDSLASSFCCAAKMPHTSSARLWYQFMQAWGLLHSCLPLQQQLQVSLKRLWTI